MPKRQKSLIFNDADLVANRAGHLTDGQRKIFQAWSDKNERSTTFLRTGGGIIGSLCVAIAVLVNNPSLLMVGGGLLLVYTVVSISQHQGLKKLHTDLEEGILLIEEGALNLQNRRLYVGDIKLKMKDWQTSRMLQFGEFYRVFYLPRTKYIVSAEQPE